VGQGTANYRGTRDLVNIINNKVGHFKLIIGYFEVTEDDRWHSPHSSLFDGILISLEQILRSFYNASVSST
jgi:hypothetical protein